MAEDKDFDLAPLDMLRRVGGNDLIEKMASIFFANAPNRLATLKGSLVSEDYPTVERCAHSLRSSAGQLGARKLERLCGQLEDAAKFGDKPGMTLLLGEAEGSFEATWVWLKTCLNPTGRLEGADQ